MKKQFDPTDRLLGAYSSTDGTVEFYGRVSSLLKPSDRVLDLGAGRAAWFHKDRSLFRRSVRLLSGKCARYVGADVDDAVLSNPTTHANLIIKDGRVDEPDGSFDLILADYVLEHITDVHAFQSEINRLLRPGGYFCARTPHKFHYVSIAARLVSNTHHSDWLKSIQPRRSREDVFPTAYKLNSLASIKREFVDWEDYSYIYPSDPAYYWGRRWIYRTMAVVHKLLPAFISGNLFVFLQKPDIQRHGA